MQFETTNRRTLPRAYAPTAIPIALSLALMAFLLMLCGCTVREEPQPSANRRHVDVKVDVDVHRPRPVCPDCPRRRAECDCGCPLGTCECVKCVKTRRQGDKETRRVPRMLPLPPGEDRGEGGLKQKRFTTPNPLTITLSRRDRELRLHGSTCQITTQFGAEHPVMNLPEQARCKNYNGGSCVCASTISLFRWQGRDDLAAALRNICSGGQSAGSLHAKLERLGVRYAATTSGDVAFLEWAVRTRRGCGIAYYPMHFVNLVDLTADHATLLDNNRVGQYITIPREEFIRRWRGFGGWATAVVYSPAAPIAKK